MKHGFSFKRSLGTKTAIVLFSAIAVVWLILDRVSKVVCNAYEPGRVFASGIPGVFDFKLAHNTGAAWSMFSNSTLALGVFSVAVCLALLLYLFGYCKGKVNILELVGLSLVFSGGLGNAIDRFAFGYVVDFIHTTFMNFPIFNVADIGVTCGVVVFMLGVLISFNEAEESEKEEGCTNA